LTNIFIFIGGKLRHGRFSTKKHFFVVLNISKITSCISILIFWSLANLQLLKWFRKTFWLNKIYFICLHTDTHSKKPFQFSFLFVIWDESKMRYESVLSLWRLIAKLSQIDVLEHKATLLHHKTSLNDEIFFCLRVGFKKVAIFLSSSPIFICQAVEGLIL
jgi:hypothetical protein